MHVIVVWRVVAAVQRGLSANECPYHHEPRDLDSNKLHVEVHKVVPPPWMLPVWIIYLRKCSERPMRYSMSVGVHGTCKASKPCHEDLRALVLASLDGRAVAPCKAPTQGR